MSVSCSRATSARVRAACRIAATRVEPIGMDGEVQGDDVTRIERLEVSVHGIVQGVFFRHCTRLEAERLGVVGTVENRPDGTVRVVAEGSRRQLEELAGWLRVGPDAAVVDRVDLSWAEATGSFLAFLILR